MAPSLDEQPDNGSIQKPRFLVVGAGSRGNSYARALKDSGLGVVAAVADPIAFKRKQFGARYIWDSSGPQTGQDFADWRDFVNYEQQRRDDEAAGLEAPPKIDGAFICVLDHQHVQVASALGPLGLHIMCEKPLGKSLAAKHIDTKYTDPSQYVVSPFCFSILYATAPPCRLSHVADVIAYFPV
jgi:threonine dehydrogenase-like Zn-dependent dehydrogenase